MESSQETYWAQCSSQSSKPPPWMLQWHEGRGYCAFSTRKFSPGDQILLERPTTWTAAWHPFTPEDKERIEIEVSELSDADKEAFYAMDNSHPDVQPRSAGIYMTNAFDMPTANDTPASAMFLAIARLNHSCTPNAQQTYVPYTADCPEEHGNAGCEVLYATREIAEGEEICDCYIELRQTTEMRRKELLEHYRFLCTCPACGPADDSLLSAEQLQRRVEDDSRRKRALKLEADILQYVAMGELEAAIDLGDDLVRLLEHEKSRGWGERYIAEACMTHSTLLQEQGKLRAALASAQKAHQWNLRLQGERSPDSVRSRNRLLELRGSIK